VAEYEYFFLKKDQTCYIHPTHGVNVLSSIIYGNVLLVLVL